MSARHRSFESIVPGMTPKERILKAILDAGNDGLNRSKVYRVFHGNRPSAETIDYLRELLADGLIRGERKETHQRGRPPEVWFITEKGKAECRQES